MAGVPPVLPGRPTPGLLALLAFALLVAAAVSLSLALGIGAARARRSVAAEVASALDVQSRTVRVLLAPGGADAADPARLARVFDGDRHVRAVVLDPRGRVRAASRPAAAGAPPAVVAHWLTPRLAPRVVVGPALSVRLEPWPANEVAETWDRARDAGAALLAFWAVAGGLAWTLTARALRPVAGLIASTERLGAGDYAVRAPVGGAAELQRLGAAFNAAALRLHASEARARALAEALARAHESERAAIARDLHDGLGAELFGARVDAKALARVLDGEARMDARRRAEILLDSVGRMQRTVRELLARLRPSAPADLGLQAALAPLLADWRRRAPEVDLDYATDGIEPARADLRDAAFRLVQEALHNSFRHGRPRTVRVSVRAEGGTLRVTVADDGRAAAEGSAPPGMGLLGMRERMLACAGRLEAGPAAGGGWRVEACAPLDRPDALGRAA